jgi:hypothetical protein
MGIPYHEGFHKMTLDHGTQDPHDNTSIADLATSRNSHSLTQSSTPWSLGNSLGKLLQRLATGLPYRVNMDPQNILISLRRSPWTAVPMDVQGTTLTRYRTLQLQRQTFHALSSPRQNSGQACNARLVMYVGNSVSIYLWPCALHTSLNITGNCRPQI